MNLKQNIILLVLFQISFYAHMIKSDVDIKITNYIPDSDSMQITCTDAHDKDELHEKKLSYKRSIEFECEKSFTRKAECNCEVKWGGNAKYFSAYKSDRDYQLCKNECRWYLTAEGPKLGKRSFLSRSPTFIAEYQWDESNGSTEQSGGSPVNEDAGSTSSLV